MKMILFSTSLIFLASFVRSDNVDYYEQLITSQIKASESYTFPENASQFQGNYFSSSVPVDAGTYDFIVIGSGSAGSVLASRLSENKQWRILLLEAGKYENDFSDIPGLYFYGLFSDYNWGFKSVPQKNSCLGMVDNRCPYPRGKAVGGSTVLNGQVYARGHHKDFDLWNQQVENGKWSYKDVLPYFKKSEKCHFGGSKKYHGFNGPLDVEYQSPLNDQYYAYISGAREKNISYVDYNAAQEIGVAETQFTLRNGKRLSAARAFLFPARERSNLKILTEAFVTKILIKNKKAYGVEFTNKGTKSVAKISKEVILSAGAIGSPAILMHSGIGPKQHLKENNVDIVKNLPVGENLFDHPCFFGFFLQSNFTQPIESLRQYIKNYLNGTGPFTFPGNMQGLGFHETPLAKYAGIPDLEFIFVPSNCTDPAAQKSFSLRKENNDAIYNGIDYTSCIQVLVILLKERSSGRVQIKSNNPFDFPLIDSNFLSDPENNDIDTIYQGVQKIIELTETNAFKKLNISVYRYTFPACRNTTYGSKDYWYCTIRQITTNIYHPLGTCKMSARNQDGVVDANLRVYGIKNLRVADASVIPIAISGHTNAPTMMIAEKISDSIKAEYGHGN